MLNADNHILKFKE